MLILCEDYCPKCNERFVKNPHCSGDYYYCENHGIVLQRYCPICGDMKPLVSFEDDLDYISNNTKIRIANMVASRYKFRYKELKNIVKSLRDIDSKNKFIKVFARRLGVPVEQITAVYT